MLLDRPTNSNFLIVVKFKSKAEYRSRVLFETIRPSFVGSFLRFSKQLNHLYVDIEIDLDNISKQFKNFGNETGHLHEKMINNFSESLEIFKYWAKLCGVRSKC